jgi:hypothetical protein
MLDSNLVLQVVSQCIFVKVLPPVSQRRELTDLLLAEVLGN